LRLDSPQCEVAGEQGCEQELGLPPAIIVDGSAIDAEALFFARQLSLVIG
jgi:hypothetical protein